MNTKIFLSAMLLAGGVALTTGCSDFLEAEDKSNISSDVYFVTEQGFEDLSTTPYYKLRTLYGEKESTNMFCSGTDLYAQGRSGYASAPLSTYRELTSENTDVLNFYTACYDGIQQCNTVIYYAEKGAAGDNVAKRVDEAKTLKAFYYYLLTQQFGSVPVSDEYIASPITSFPRIPQKDVYEYIIGILEGVEQNNILPMDDHTGRISMRTVYNFLAKVYLAYAWDTNTTANADGTNVQVTDRSNFAKAAAYADKAINGQTPSMSFSDMWDVANEDNNDILFAIKYTRGISGQDELTTGNQQQAQFGNYYNDVPLTKYTTSYFPASEKLIYLFEPGDERYEGTFMVEQAEDYMNYYLTGLTPDTKILYYFPAWYEDLSKITEYNSSAANHEETNVFSSSDPCVYVKVTVNKRTGKITYSKATQRYSTSRTTTSQSMVVRKFDDYEATRNTTEAVSFHDIVLAHLTETYLLAAEAYYMAGDEPTSLARLNVVRERSNATKLNSYAEYVRHYSDGTANSYNNGSGIANVPYETNLDPIDVILDERARELCGEYYRWMDLRRTKRLITYNVKYNAGINSADDMMGVDGQYKWFRPFPQNEINLNDAIDNSDQTPGYVTSGDSSEAEEE